MNKYSIKLIEFLKEKSNKGKQSITIPLKKTQRGFNSFEINPIYKDSNITGINVEQRVMPADKIFRIEIFDLVLELLSKADNYTLENGNAVDFKMGESGLHEKTIEYAVAKIFYEKEDGQSIHRRISIISNILIAANLCEARPSSLKLNIK